MLFNMILFPILGGYLASVMIQPVLISRYLICVLPPFLLLAANGLRIIAVHRKILITAAIGVVATFIPSLLNGLNPNAGGFDFRAAVAHDPVDDFRSAVREFSQRYAATDHVLLLVRWNKAPLQTAPFLYYWRDPTTYIRGHYAVDEIHAEEINVDRLWIFSVWQPRADLEKLRTAVTATRHHEEVYSSKFGNVKVMLFQSFDRSG